MGNRIDIVIAVFVGLFFSFALLQGQAIDKIKSKVNHLSYENTDSCTWVTFNEAAIRRIFGGIKRERDSHPVETVNFYACVDYKDYQKERDMEWT